MSDYQKVKREMENEGMVNVEGPSPFAEIDRLQVDMIALRIELDALKLMVRTLRSANTALRAELAEAKAKVERGERRMLNIRHILEHAVDKQYWIGVGAAIVVARATNAKQEADDAAQHGEGG